MKRTAGLLLLTFLALTPAAVHAQSAEDAFATLASPSYETVRQGVGALAVSGHPQAAAILAALQANRLFARTADKALFIKADDGSFTDATTGKSASAVMASGLKPVRMNNAVRGEVEAALGSLRLLSPNAAIRLEAAETVFHSHDPAALPALDRALARETDAAVKLRMQQAHAAALLSADGSSETDRLQAVEVLRQRGDIDSRSLLASLSNGPPAIAEAATAAVKAIDWNLQLWGIAQSAYYGLSLGSVLLLAAAGLAITFGVMGVINMAHGEMVMIGAYVTFLVQQAVHDAAPALFGGSLLIA
ncbi:MAG TPA: urea ABC transporter permease subunit UrtB, partial [Acetobacteraceae bacterium]|nr:urea ABC transporter permease subunit UrtB [Acetobacteraceae bacterium]